METIIGLIVAGLFTLLGYIVNGKLQEQRERKARAEEQAQKQADIQAAKLKAERDYEAQLRRELRDELASRLLQIRDLEASKKQLEAEQDSKDNEIARLNGVIAAKQEEIVLLRTKLQVLEGGVDLRRRPATSETEKLYPKE